MVTIATAAVAVQQINLHIPRKGHTLVKQTLYWRGRALRLPTRIMGGTLYAFNLG
jgi:hypothetical protein